MIELLLVVIIALICLAIYGTTYYFLKVKANTTDGCPICPDCNVSCPEMPVCPECKQCPEHKCPECKQCPEHKCPEIQEFGFRNNLSNLKKLFNSINNVSKLTIEKYCTNADSIKTSLDEKITRITILEDLDCKNILSIFKSEVLIQNDVDQYELSEEQIKENEIITYTFEIAEILISPENCREDGKTNKVKVVNFLKNIIDGFCYDDYDESVDQTGEDHATIVDDSVEQDDGSSGAEPDLAVAGQQDGDTIENVPSTGDEYLSNNSVNIFCRHDENQDCPPSEAGGLGYSRGGICYYQEVNAGTCSNIDKKEECHIDVATYEEDPENNQKPTGKYVKNDNGQNVYCRWRDESTVGDPESTNNGMCVDAGICLDEKKLIGELRENGSDDTINDCDLCEICQGRGVRTDACNLACSKCQR